MTCSDTAKVTRSPRAAHVLFTLPLRNTNSQSRATLIEATETDPGDRPEIQKNVWPTGRWFVITREAAARIFNVEIRTAHSCRENVIEMLGLDKVHEDS